MTRIQLTFFTALSAMLFACTPLAMEPVHIYKGEPFTPKPADDTKKIQKKQSLYYSQLAKNRQERNSRMCLAQLEISKISPDVPSVLFFKAILQQGRW